MSHHGVKGQKHGVRRWQNEDGSYTSAGYAHYAEMYGWGKKKNPKQLDADAKRHTENAKLAVKAAGAASLPTVLTTTALGVTQYAANAKSAALTAAVSDNVTNITQKLWNMIEASRYANIAEEAGNLRAFTGIIGGSVAAACVAGAVSLGAVAAFCKARSALQKRKLNKLIAEDEQKNSMKHSDHGETTASDLLDSLTDDQKLAVVMAIDAVLKAKTSD